MRKVPREWSGNNPWDLFKNPYWIINKNPHIKFENPGSRVLLVINSKRTGEEKIWKIDAFSSDTIHSVKCSLQDQIQRHIFKQFREQGVHYNGGLIPEIPKI